MKFGASVINVAIFALVTAVPALAGVSAENDALREAALSHNIERVTTALERGADPNAPSSTERHFSPLTLQRRWAPWRMNRDRTIDLAQNKTAAQLDQAGFSAELIDQYLAVEVTKLLFAAADADARRGGNGIDLESLITLQRLQAKRVDNWFTANPVR